MWKIDTGTKNGDSSSLYASALEWKVAELGPKSILLKNTHSSASLKYKLLAYLAPGGIGKELVSETVLEAGEIAEFHYNKQWDRFVLMLANGSGTASYRLDYQGQGI